MRIRTIKPEYFQHEMHGKISETAAIMAVGLLCMADDAGRFRPHPTTVRSLVFTCRDKTLEQINEAMKELEDRKWFFRYKARIDGEESEVAQITTFRRHQNINKPQKSRFPDPLPSHSVPTPFPLPSHSVPIPNTQETPESDDYVPTTGGRKEGKEGKEGRKEREYTRSPQFQEPSLGDVLTYGNMHCILPDCARKWFYEQKGAGWLDKHGRPITDWQSKLQGYAVSWRENDFKKTGPGKPALPNEEAILQLEAELEGETDPEKRKALRAQIRKLKGEP